MTIVHIIVLYVPFVKYVTDLIYLTVIRYRRIIFIWKADISNVAAESIRICLITGIPSPVTGLFVPAESNVFGSNES